MDWSGINSGISVRKLISTSKKEKRRWQMNCQTFSQNPCMRGKSHHLKHCDSIPGSGLGLHQFSHLYWIPVYVVWNVWLDLFMQILFIGVECVTGPVYVDFMWCGMCDWTCLCRFYVVWNVTGPVYVDFVYWCGMCNWTHLCRFYLLVCNGWLKLFM